MSSQAWKQVLALRDAFRDPEVIDSGWYHIYRHDKCIKRVTRTHFWPFLRVFNFFCVSAHVIAYFQSFLSPRMHPQVPTCVFKPDCSFSTCFQLLSAVFFFKKIIHFHLFSIDFIHFQSSLFVFNYYYPNSIVTACFQLFF